MNTVRFSLGLICQLLLGNLHSRIWRPPVEGTPTVADLLAIKYCGSPSKNVHITAAARLSHDLPFRKPLSQTIMTPS